MYISLFHSFDVTALRVMDQNGVDLVTRVSSSELIRPLDSMMAFACRCSRAAGSLAYALRGDALVQRMVVDDIGASWETRRHKGQGRRDEG